MAYLDSTIKFSIIIPMYNSEKYIEESINSVLGQIHRNFELIVVDDGSTDTSLEICRSLADNPECLIILTQKNLGPNVARNFGLDHSSGDYVVFLDADDLLNKNALADISVAIISENPDFVSYGFDFFDSETKKIISKTKYPTKVIENDNVLHCSFIGKYIAGVCWNKCINLSFINSNNIRFVPDRKHGRDILFSRQCAFYSSKVYVLSNILCHSRFHVGSFSRKFSAENILSSIDLARRQTDFFALRLSKKMVKLANHSIGRHHRYILILSAFRSGSFSEFSEHLKIIQLSEFGRYLKGNNIYSNRKDKLLTFLLEFPRLCWVIVYLLKKLDYQPY